MEKFIAVVFDTEEAAYKGADALRELHKDGELAVYAAGIIAKDAEGIVEVKKTADEGPIGTAFGMMLGAMVGVLAGPAAVASGAAVAGTAAAAQVAAGGMAVGGMTGGLFGVYRDLWVSGMDITMLENVGTELLPGKSCVVASVDEVWTTPLDSKMADAGGTVFRKLRVDAVDDELSAELTALDREMSDLADEMDAAADESKAAIKAKVDAGKARATAAKEKMARRVDEMDREFDARLDAIDEQIANASERTKEKFQKRKAEIKEDYTARKKKIEDSLDVADAILV
jgi:uncharacterized membrane protein